jgi:hypothetical protein
MTRQNGNTGLYWRHDWVGDFQRGTSWGYQILDMTNPGQPVIVFPVQPAAGAPLWQIANIPF